MALPSESYRARRGFSQRLATFSQVSVGNYVGLWKRRAIECVNDRAWLVGIQWHPEWLDGSPQGGPHRCPGAPLFESLVARATAGRT